MLCCYACLLRVREALSLLYEDVIFTGTSFVLCLSRTKTGVEQKVVLTHPHMVQWILCFLRSFASEPGRPVFRCSYHRMLRWTSGLSERLGCGGVHLTTHSFRRSGAT